MEIKKTLTNIVLSGILALNIAGCNKDHLQYKYDGKIGEDQVTFTKKGYDNILTVTKSDGKIIKYVDNLRDDLKLEYVDITKDGKTTRHISDYKIGKEILEEKQKQFDVYVQQIKEIKFNQRLQNLI